MDSPQHHLNPHEAPPQALKDIFKTWKAPTKEWHEYPGCFPDEMQLWDAVPRDRLARAFQDFEDASNHSEQPASIFSSVNIPGNMTLGLSL